MKSFVHLIPETGQLVVIDYPESPIESPIIWLAEDIKGYTSDRMLIARTIGNIIKNSIHLGPL